jgi:16S rRNA (uracil1498-N3)-methyltransferase
MQFVYHENAGQTLFSIEEELYKYLIKVRRHTLNDVIGFRNLKDSNVYEYQIESISKKNALLTLIKTQECVVESKQTIHLAWCVFDTKTIEKELPYLNELGVQKLSFVYADYSQKNFKLNFEKYTKILINSCQQCGRSSLMQFEVFNSVDEYVKEYPQSFMFNFAQRTIEASLPIQSMIIGCEGGFSKREVGLFDVSKIVGVNSNLILRSETAITVVAAKLIV